MPDDDPTTADLCMDAVVRVSGEDGLAKLLALAGGTAITLPIFPSENSLIVRALGMDDARKVCAEMRVLDGDGRPVGCAPFYLPMGRESRTVSRRRKVAELDATGMSGRAIAIALGVSERTVRKHLSKLRKAGKLPKAAMPFSRSGGAP